MAKILVVNDTDANVQVIRKVLTAEGHEILTASSGRQALGQFSAHNPDLVITDVNMPLMDGFEIAREIRKAAMHAPVIFTSAIYREVAANAGPMEAGDNEYLPGPLDFDELKYKVTVMLERKSLHDRLGETVKKLTFSKRLCEETFNAIPDLVMIIDNENRILDVNRAMTDKTGLKREQLIGMPCHKVIHGLDRQPADCPHSKTLSGEIAHREEIYDEHLHGYYLFSTTPMFDENGEVSGVLEIVHDITDRKKAELRLEESEEKARAVIEASMDALIVIDGKGVISYFNTAAEKIFGYMQEEIIGKRLHDILVSEKARKQYNDKLPGFEKTGQCEVIGKTLEVTAVRKDGTSFPVELSLSSFNIKGEWHSVGTVRDITERKRMEGQLREAAITDDLTGLFNRRGFFTVAEQQRKFAVRNKRKLALLYVDLNNMKDINDRFGHGEGDRALKDTAGILRKAFRDSDISARIGGDEFAVLLTDPAGPDNEHIIINHIEDQLTEHNRQSDRPFELSLSLGMAHFDPGMPCPVTELLARADAAMYENKRQYKNSRLTVPDKFGRRGHERHEVARKHWAEIPGSGKLEIKNISVDGICIRTSLQLPVNSIHDISILPSGNGGIKPKCRVIWSLLIKEDSGSNKTSYETGLRFIDLNSKVKSLLEELIMGLSI